ncbi:dickkopf-related protein 3 [Penaeus vannamei]|uniref:dickkopf-related protein 3 n=1 Tax=Penaeus vannamei TaxID=6689 RepID=UPI00387F5F20
MNLCLFFLTVGCLVTPCMAQGLSWLFRRLHKAGRHNIRDISGGRHNSHQLTTDQPFDFYKDLRLCTNDRVCGRGQFCDQHYGVCRDHVTEGRECRRDAMCEGGYNCMFGLCQKRIKRGREGARCRKERDCGAGMCCARRHGEQVCQRRVPLGHKCYVPEGGLDYSMNQLCPCESGLVCKYTAQQPPSRHQLMALMSAHEDMRCAAPSHRVD